MGLEGKLGLRKAKAGESRRGIQAILRADGGELSLKRRGERDGGSLTPGSSPPFPAFSPKLTPRKLLCYCPGLRRAS
jgi:hypothetical protein